MNPSQWKEAHEVAPMVHQNVVLQDTTPAMLVQFSPLLGASAVSTTTCTIALVQGGDMTWLVDSAAPTGIDAIGTAGVISTAGATADTVGELCNVINAAGGPHRAICLCSPDVPSANLLAKSAASAVTANGLVFYLDSSVADTTYLHSLPIMGERFVNNGINGHIKETNIINYFHYGQFTADFTSACTFTIKMFKQGDTAPTTLFTQAMVDATLTNIGHTANPMLPFIQGRQGYVLVAEWRSDASFDTDPTVCNIGGKSVVLDGGPIVTKVPYLTT